MIKFSIVTITYNAGACLQRTLDSVISQHHPHIEHIIVDGASKDNTIEMAYSYEKQSLQKDNGHKVRIVSEPDRGIYDAMNKGLRMATGDYICFLNAGDFFPAPNTLDIIIEKGGLESTASPVWPAVIYGRTDIVDNNGRFLHPRRLVPPKKLSWRSFRYGMLVCHQAFYARLDIARSIEYDTRYRFSADVDWCIRVMKEAARRQLPLTYADAVVANYTEEGQSTINHRASLRERYQVMVCHYGKITTALMHLWFAVRTIFKIKKCNI